MSEKVKAEVDHLLFDRPDAELRQLALDILDGRVFTSQQIGQYERVEMILMIFMPLLLMDEHAAKQMAARGPGLIYEHMSKALPRTINGYPTFFSFHVLSKPDTVKITSYIKELETQRKAFLETK